MKHSYSKIAFTGGMGFQEINRDGLVVRLTDDGGATISPTEYSVTNANPNAPAWATDDQTPEPQLPEVVFPVLSRRQLRHGLLSLGITAQDVEQVIAAIPNPIERERALIEFQDATEMQRAHPLIAALSASFPALTVEVIDAAWFAASQI